MMAVTQAATATAISGTCTALAVGSPPSQDKKCGLPLRRHFPMDFCLHRRQLPLQFRARDFLLGEGGAAVAAEAGAAGAAALEGVAAAHLAVVAVALAGMMRAWMERWV